MQKKIFTAYFFILATLLIIMSVSKPSTESMRGGMIGLLAPLWEKVLSVKFFVNHPTQSSPFSTLSKNEEIQQLQLANERLQTEIAYLHQVLHEHTRLAEDSLKRQSPPFTHAIPARVIFRSFDSWNNTLWINVGEKDNQPNQSPVIAKNSSIIAGKAIAGLIDYVGKNHSRVRLITDSTITPAVRAVRGGEQDVLMLYYLEGLLEHADQEKFSHLSSEDRNQLLHLLQKWKNDLQPHVKSWYLAKGVLHGSRSFNRRSSNPLLKGTGFNYDFPDEEGGGRDLRTGKPLQDLQEPTMPILKVRDVLITTGMDGVFPPGFQVATITKIGLLKEGDYFYDIEAKPIAGPLEELSLVFVLPPITDESPQNLGMK